MIYSQIIFSTTTMPRFYIARRLATITAIRKMMILLPLLDCCQSTKSEKMKKTRKKGSWPKFAREKLLRVHCCRIDPSINLNIPGNHFLFLSINMQTMSLRWNASVYMLLQYVLMQINTYITRLKEVEKFFQVSFGLRYHY